MTVAEMRRRMSNREWMEWSVLYEIEAEERERAERKAGARRRGRRR